MLQWSYSFTIPYNCHSVFHLLNYNISYPTYSISYLFSFLVTLVSPFFDLSFQVAKSWLLLLPGIFYSFFALSHVSTSLLHSDRQADSYWTREWKCDLCDVLPVKNLNFKFFMFAENTIVQSALTNQCLNNQVVNLLVDCHVLTCFRAVWINQRF